MFLGIPITHPQFFPQKTSVASSYCIREIFEKEVKPAFSCADLK